MKQRWAVSMVLTKPLSNGSTDIGHRLVIVSGETEDEARGVAVKDALENNSGYALKGICILKAL